MEDDLQQPSTATEELYHTNLLRHQATELLSESVLPLSSHIGMLENEVKWAKDVWQYMDNVKRILKSLNGAALSPDDVTFQSHGDNTDKESASSFHERFWVKLHSDKAKKHLEHIMNKDENSTNRGNNHHRFDFEFPGGDHLKVSPIHSYAANGAGLTTSFANANVVPTLDLAVLMPVKSKFEEEDRDDSGDRDDVGMIGGKDYLNGRYFDKRNILAVHVAKFLSQKKQRKTIGSVHLVHELDGDYRKVCLILTPPLSSDPSQSEKQPKNKSKVEDGSAKKKKKNKIRFRVRLVFGVQFDGAKNTPDNNTGWIPSARLFPDRCNNKVAEIDGQETTNNPTPTYNNSLAGDLHFLSNTQILHSVTVSAPKAFTESWALLKIWCLQRGFLRGRDTFTDMSLGMSLAYLYRSKMVSSRMDSIQVFTVWMKFISDQDWLGDKDQSKKKGTEVNENTIRYSAHEGYQDLNIMSTRGKKYRAGFVMPDELSTEKQTILNCIQNRLYASDIKKQSSTTGIPEDVPMTLLESFKLNTDSPIFLDPSMTVNYFGNISPSFIQELQNEAKKALECIHFHRDNSSEEASAHRIDPFRQLFLENIRFWQRYDAYLCLELKDISIPNLDKTNANRRFWGFDAQDRGCHDSIANGVVKVLNMALGNRIHSLRLLTSGNGDTKGPSNNAASVDLGTTVIVESDEIPMIPIRHSADSAHLGYRKNDISRNKEMIHIGLRINRDTCHRLVDRGPPADDTKGTSDFVALWGQRKAQLRRFKDGAIVHAVVWNEPDDNKGHDDFIYESGDKVGDIVERIIQHILWGHFLKCDSQLSLNVKFQLRNLVSLVEGAKNENTDSDSALIDSAEGAHKSISSAYEKLATFLKKNSELEPVVGLNESISKLGLPLSIDGVEPLSPALRYTACFPQLPHPFLGSNVTVSKKISGAISNDPILIQIRFEGSTKWPNDISAMGAAKCAMLIQIAEGIEAMKEKREPGSELFDGPMNVSPTFIDFGYGGYSWRAIIRADQEMKMLKTLHNPSPEATALLQALTKNHVKKSLHHFTVHGVTSKFPAAGYVVRLLNRWLAAHMLSGQISHEAVELLVVSVFTDPLPFDTPNTVSSGFLRCLQLIAEHNWLKKPLIVDSEGHIHTEDRCAILSQFEEVRGVDFQHGPPMFIISPIDRNEEGLWRPSFTQSLPEKVVLGRLSALAGRSHQYLMNCLKSGKDSKSFTWTSIFLESPDSFKSYSALFRVNHDNIVDSTCSSTASDLGIQKVDGILKTPYRRSMERLPLGLKAFRRTAYKNLNNTSSLDSLLYEFKPVDEAVGMLRTQFGQYALFFYNEHCPDMIAMLWRPTTFQWLPFSAMHAEFCTPTDYQWEENTLVTKNSNDILRAIRCALRHVIVDFKVLDDRSIKDSTTTDEVVQKAKRKLLEDDSSDDSDS